MSTVTRRAFLKATAAGVAVVGFPLPLRAQAKTVKVGLIHTVTGPLAEPGQACRAGAQLAADMINAAGGITSLGGAKIEFLLGDTQTKSDVARTEAERVINQGAQVLMGTFDSGNTAAIVPVAQQRRVPFLVDVAAADPITANVAKSVKAGQQKVQYVYRNFPTGSSFGRRAVQYFNEIFKETGQNPRRVVVMHANDLFGSIQAKGFKAAWDAAKPSWEIVDVIPWPEPPSDLSTEVSRAKALKPDIIAPITRPASAQLLLPELIKQRVEVLGVISPGSPGLYEAGQIAALKQDLEYVMDNVPWPNFKNPKTQQVAAEYRKRTGGKTFDTQSGYSYDAVFILADVLERAKSTDPDAIVDAIKKTRFSGGLMVYGGPVIFNDLGDNPNAIPAMIQILGQKPLVVWPKDAAQEKLVFPRPKR
ncbi:MAG: ABC transporter substrate-binding protein [Candidatus Rokubacteria bacterium]|nr:ABC transporter substrate-binding protein [Candidatus Rokubacteria bacterium]